jgi:hypothetical protein
MEPEHIGILVDAAIPVLAGTFLTLLAFRIVGPKPGEKPKMDAWHDRWGKWMKVLGPLVVGFALITAAAAVLR